LRGGRDFAAQAARAWGSIESELDEVQPDRRFGLEQRTSLKKGQNGSSHLVLAAQVSVGAGQSGLVKLSDEAADYFKRKDCQVELLPTPKAIEAWNEAKGAVIALFHVTC
jgi:hypothetical protein